MLRVPQRGYFDTEAGVPSLQTAAQIGVHVLLRLASNRRELNYWSDFDNVRHEIEAVMQDSHRSLTISSHADSASSRAGADSASSSASAAWGASCHADADSAREEPIRERGKEAANVQEVDLPDLAPTQRSSGSGTLENSDQHSEHAGWHGEGLLLNDVSMAKPPDMSQNCRAGLLTLVSLEQSHCRSEHYEI
jgi:hypothetical protein